jgi:molecular chaperone Hsp33
MNIARSGFLAMIHLVLARGFQRQAHFCRSSVSTSRFGLRFVYATILNSQSSNSSSEDSSTVTSASSALAEYQNSNNIRDQVFSALSKDGSVKVTVCTARNLLNDMMLSHTLSKTSADALGRAIVCALMISNGMQQEQTLQITINSDGPIRGIVAISTGKGEVRGYVGSPMLGDMKLSEAVGLGSVQVVKNHPDWPNPYNGITAIRNGEIDRDLGAYLAESEQRSCALAAGTSINGILCTAAGGYLVEQLPGADSETLERISSNLAALVAKDGGDALPTNLLQKGVSPLDIAEILLDGLEMQPLQQIEPVFKCHCTPDRLVRALRLLSPADVEDLLQREEAIAARCEFCGKSYSMTKQEVRDEMSKQSGDPAKDEDFYGSKD